MAKYATLKTAIEEVITSNGNYEISGEDLREILKEVVNSLGANYQFVGLATPETDPGTPDQNVAYLAGPGTYPNFGPTTVKPGEIGIFKYNGTWDVKVVQTDTTTDVININAIANHPAGYATPALALADVPERYRKLGCTVVYKDDTTEMWVMMICVDNFTIGDDWWTDFDNNWKWIGPVELRSTGYDENYVLHIGLNTDLHIIDGLESNTPYYVLSAKQGKLLNEKIEGWSQEVETIDTTGVQLPRPLLNGMVITKIENASKLIFTEGSTDIELTPDDLPYKIQYPTFIVKTESGTASNVKIVVRGSFTDDFINVNDYYAHASAYASAQAARADVALTERKKGLYITYLLSVDANTTLWVTDQFIGNDITDWGVADNWKVIGPVTVSQNTITEHTEINIGQSKNSIPSRTEVNAINLKLDKVSETMEVVYDKNNTLDFPINIPNGATFKVKINNTDGSVTQLGQRLRVNGSAWGTVYLNKNQEYTFVADTNITQLGIYIAKADVASDGVIVFDVKYPTSISSRLSVLEPIVEQNTENIETITDHVLNEEFNLSGINATVAITQNSRKIIDKPCYIKQGQQFKFILRCTDGSVHNVGQKLRVNGEAWGTQYLNENTLYTFTADTLIETIGIYVGAEAAVGNGNVTLDVTIVDSVDDRLDANTKQINTNTDNIASDEFKASGIEYTTAITQNTQKLIQRPCYIRQGEVFRFVLKCDDGCVHNVGQKLRINDTPYGTQYLNENIVYEFTAPELITLIGIYIGAEAAVGNGNVTLDVTIVQSVDYRIDELGKKIDNLHSIFGKNMVVFGDSIMQIMATTEFPYNTVSYVDSEDNEYTSADITIINGKIWLTSSLSGGVPTEDSIQLDIKNSAQQIFDNQDWVSLKNKLGVKNLYNMGLGGASIFGRQIETSYPYNDGDAKTCCLANEVRWLVRRYNNNEVKKPDCILIWLGTNDSTYPNKTVNNYDDVMALTFAELDSDANYSYRATFYGGLRWSLEKLYLTFPHINIILATPTQAKHNERPYARQIEIGDMIKKMANRYSCIVVDACREIGVVDIFEPNKFTYDGLHPNTAGKVLWSNFIANKLLNEYSNR